MALGIIGKALQATKLLKPGAEAVKWANLTRAGKVVTVGGGLLAANGILNRTAGYGHMGMNPMMHGHMGMPMGGMGYPYY